MPPRRPIYVKPVRPGPPRRRRAASARRLARGGRLIAAALALALALGLGAPQVGRSQTTADGPGDPVVAPAEATTATSPAPSPICTDRPTKSNYACTVDAGHLQYETDLVNGAFLRLDGTTTDIWLVLNPTVKYGLTSDVDIEANLSPFEVVRTRAPDGDQRSVAGVGDLYLRLKRQLLNLDGGVLQATLLPYVKAPTARVGVGDGAVEGGLILPINYKLTSNLTLTVDPEVDFDKDSIGSGRHPNTAQLINLGLSLPFNLTLFGELWGDWNFDPAGVVKQYSADTAIALGVTPELQLDAGLNVGLNRQTPGVQAYVGVSQKF